MVFWQKLAKNKIKLLLGLVWFVHRRRRKKRCVNIRSNEIKTLKIDCESSINEMDCVIIGKSPTLDVELVNKLKSQGALVISANNPTMGIKPDICFMQDCIIEDYGQVLNVCVDVLAERKVNEHIKREYYKKSLSVNDNSKELCFYPYTGVACLQWVQRQGIKKVYVSGFSFDNNHNHIDGYIQSREEHCLNIYKQNCADIINLMLKSGVQIQGDEILKALKPLLQGGL